MMREIVMKFGTYSHVTLRVDWDNFGDPLNDMNMNFRL